jgi:hypothetical protein
MCLHGRLRQRQKKVLKVNITGRNLDNVSVIKLDQDWINSGFFACCMKPSGCRTNRWFAYIWLCAGDVFVKLAHRYFY